ncbi:MAG: hypothetical protein GX781_04940 [Clostridiales bacterium]|nr:hypothetical protein [Clostridiales bacterium]
MNLMLGVSAVLPILIYMLGGAILKRAKMLSDTTLNEVNRIIFSYCFPFLIFNSIYRTNIKEALNPGFLWTMVVLFLLVTAIVLVIFPKRFASKPVLGSMLQGVVRSNSLLFALPVVIAITGKDRAGLASLSIAVMVPLSNIVSVIILEVLRGDKLCIKSLLLSIVKNPIIAGALAALAVKGMGIRFPAVAERMIGDIASLVTPIALVTLGAGLKLADTVFYRRELRAVCIMKLLVTPLIFVLVIKALGFDGTAVLTAMALSAVPTAVSSYPTAKAMGADAVLAGQIVAVTSTLSILSVFMWVLTLSALGWIGG